MTARAATLLAALAGGLAARALGLPAGLLIGATLGALALAATRWGAPPPDGLRDAGFAAIGLSLGSGIDREGLAAIALWPGSLLGMVVALGLTWAACVALLVRGFGLGRDAALLGTSPGALSYVLALSEDRRLGADRAAIAGLQSVRLLLVTLLVAPLIGPSALGAPPAADWGAPLPWAAALLGALLLAPVMTRLRVPAASMLAGFAVSAALHLAGLLEGRPHPLVLGAGLVIAGAVIGARVAALPAGGLRRLLGAAVAAGALALAMTWALSGAAALLLGLPHPQLWLAYAPGGVEAMAAIALALGVDPAFVAVHHVARLLVLFVAAPLLVRTR